MAVIQYLRERRKLLLFVLVIYAIGFHIFYNYYWKQKAVDTPTGIQRILESIWSRYPLLRNGTGDAYVVEKAVEVDIHVEHPVLGHTGEVIGGSHLAHVAQFNVTTIAIGGGITSKGVQGVDASNIASKFQLFFTFLPTFCTTASPGYEYRFYFAYDSSDSVFTNVELLAAFQNTFANEMRRLCKEPRNIKTSIHMVQCSHAGRPTWAQNDAMLEAYLDHVDYYYRVNDDTRMHTDGWVEAFIKVLDQYNPLRVGVVGPNHSGGNTAILTYDFVHRTHVDIFGFYYPRLFTDWFADDWVTIVYRPDRSTKLSNIRLAHTLGLGQRYKNDVSIAKKLPDQLKHDTETLKRYIEAVKSNKASGVKPDGRKVISMSLYGKDPRYTWGVLRNAQLLPVYLPDWTLRVYVSDNSGPPELAVPPRILNKLRLMGVEILHVSTTNTLRPRNWRLMVASDQQVDYFLVRDADNRLSEREAAAVRDWLSVAEKNGSQSAVIHCIRDHPKYANQAIVNGLWGGRPRTLYQRLNKYLTDIPLLSSPSATSKEVGALLNEVLWPAVAEVAYCHDSVSPCDRWTTSRSRPPFPTSRAGQEYLGQKFDEHQELVSQDGNELKPDVLCPLAAHVVVSPSTFYITRTPNSSTLRPSMAVVNNVTSAPTNRTL